MLINQHNWYSILPPILFPSQLVNNINRGLYEVFSFVHFVAILLLRGSQSLKFCYLVVLLCIVTIATMYLIAMFLFFESLMVVFPLVSFHNYLGIWFHQWSSDWFIFYCYVNQVGSLVEIFKAMFKKLGGHFLVIILGN